MSIGGQFLPDDEVLRRYTAYVELGSYTAAANLFGVSESAMRKSVKAATQRNLTGEFMGPALPPGYTMGKVTSLVAANGTKMEWQHKLPEADAVEQMVEVLIEHMNQSITPLPEITAPDMETQDHDLLTLYPVVDVHLGMYAWSKESGENYDLDIAKQQFLASVGELFISSPLSHTALIVVLGDFFHADNNNAVTERSGNHLDVDGRHDKVLHLGTELIIWMIDMALQKHTHVVVHVCRGNHDPYASKALGMALWFRYQGNDRVVIDRSPADLWSYSWGLTMLSFTHGDNIKAEEMPGAMSAMYSIMWGETKFRYGYSGHYHKNKKGPTRDEKHGAIWEILPAFTAKDAWNAGMGHTSLRTVISKTFHKQRGLKRTVDENV